MICSLPLHSIHTALGHYPTLRDPDCHDPPIEELRPLHEEMDRALEAFEDEVIDRLFVLNAERAEEEKRQALVNPPKTAPKRGRGRKPKDDGGAQGSLLD